MMKNLLFVLLLCGLQSFAQPKPKPVENVRLAGSNSTITLYQTKNGVETQAGSVAGLLRDENGNLIVGVNPTLTNSLENFIWSNDAIVYKSNENISFANHIHLDSVRRTFSTGADHRLYRGGDFSTTLGDGNEQGGYAGYVDGSGSKNFVAYGRSGGLITENSEKEFSNLYSLSDVYGLRMINKGSYNFSRGRQLTTVGNDIIALGYSNTQTTVTAPGFHIIYGIERFAVLPNGKVFINGITYNFPAVQQPGVLTNDGNRNLSWQPQASKPDAGTYAWIDPQTGRISYLVRVK